MRPLSLGLSPYPNESFLGFLDRAAVESCFGSLRNILNELDLPHTSHIQILGAAHESDYIADALQVPQEWLQKVTIALSLDAEVKDVFFHGLSLPKTHVCRPGRKYAPAALKASAHDRFYWHIAGITYDFETFELLNNSCPSCKKRLRFSGTVPMSMCDQCFTDLTRFEVNSVSREDRPHLRLVSDLFSDDPLCQARLRVQLPPMMRQWNRGVVYQIIRAFGRACVNIPNGKAVFPSYPVDLIEGAKIVREFPQRLKAHLTGTSDLIVPEFFTRIREAIPSATSPDVRVAIEALLGAVRAYQPRGIGARSERMKQKGYYGIREAAGMLGIKASQARMLVDQKIISGERLHKGARNHFAIHTADIVALERELTDKIAIAQITGHYGLSQTAVEQLMAINLIRPHSHRAVSKVYAGAHAKLCEVENLANKLFCAIPVVPENDLELIPLSKAMALYGPRPRPWSGLLHAAMFRRLPGGLYRVENKRDLSMKNLGVDERLFASIWDNRVPWRIRNEPDRPHCSGIEVEERLSLFPRDVHSLLATGHLTKVPQTQSFSRYRVLQVAHTYISATEIAARAGIPATSVKAWTVRNKIDRPSRDFPMWRRSDLEPHLPPTRITWETSDHYLIKEEPQAGGRNPVKQLEEIEDPEGLGRLRKSRGTREPKSHGAAVKWDNPEKRTA